MAQDSGGMSRDQFAQTVIERVRDRFPLVKIARAQQPFSVRVNGHVASLENLWRVHQLKPMQLQHHIERWAVELLRAGEGSPDRDGDFEDVADRLLPMILPCEESSGTSPVKGLTIGGAPGTEHLASQPLVPGLCIGYVIDGDRTIAYISWDTLRRWGIELDELHEKALFNLVQRSENMNARAAHDENKVINLILFQILDGFDASRLILPTLHERLREHLGSPFVAAIPNRDILLCFRNDPDTVEGLRGQIRSDYHTMPHQVTDRLLLITPDGIAPYD